MQELRKITIKKSELILDRFKKLTTSQIANKYGITLKETNQIFEALDLKKSRNKVEKTYELVVIDDLADAPTTPSAVNKPLAEEAVLESLVDSII